MSFALNPRQDYTMNTMTETRNLPVVGKQKMTPSEAFVETLVAQGVKDVFGIVGSAYMDALDLFPLAGIRFISVAHEQGGGHMADGYARASGRHGVCIAQNGPGVTNFVTSTAAAYWAHSPVVVVTPETGSMTLGRGGLQETEQRPIVPRVARAVVRGAWLSGLEGGDEAHCQGRRRSGVGHAPGPVRHAAATRARLLADEREDRADRRRPNDAGAREADLGRGLWRCES